MTMIYSPKEGHSFNPLSKSKYRNLLCPCKSKKKVKKCHGLMKTIEDKFLATINSWIKDNK